MFVVEFPAQVNLFRKARLRIEVSMLEPIEPFIIVPVYIITDSLPQTASFNLWLRLTLFDISTLLAIDQVPSQRPCHHRIVYFSLLLAKGGVKYVFFFRWQRVFHVRFQPS